MTASPAAAKAVMRRQTNNRVTPTDMMAGIAGATGEAGSTVKGLTFAAINHVLKQYGASALSAGQGNMAIAADFLSKRLAAGAPIADIIAQASKLGLPQELINNLKQSANQ